MTTIVFIGSEKIPRTASKNLTVHILENYANFQSLRSFQVYANLQHTFQGLRDLWSSNNERLSQVERIREEQHMFSHNTHFCATLLARSAVM